MIPSFLPSFSKTSWFLIFLSFSVVLTGCSKTDVGENSSVRDLSRPVSLEARNVTVDFENYADDMQNIWNVALNDYGMDVICSCECSRVDMIVDIFENHSDDSEYINANAFDGTSCVDLLDMFSNDCNFEDETEAYADFATSWLDSLDEYGYVSQDEKVLIANILDDAQDGVIDIESHRAAWYALESTSSLDNSFSLLIIETSTSIEQFLTGTPGISDVDEPQAIFSHLAGAVAGAGISLWVDTVYDVVTYGEPQGSPFDAMIKGAIGGAIGGI